MAEVQKIVSCTGQSKDANIYNSRVYWLMIKSGKNYIRSKLVNNVESYPNYEEDLIQLQDGNIQGYNFILNNLNNYLYLYYSVDEKIYLTIFNENYIPQQIDIFLFNGIYPQIHDSNFLNGIAVFFYLNLNNEVLQYVTKDYLNFYGLVNLTIQKSWPIITKFDVQKNSSGKFIFSFET